MGLLSEVQNARLNRKVHVQCHILALVPSLSLWRKMCTGLRSVQRHLIMCYLPEPHKHRALIYIRFRIMHPFTCL